MVLCLVMASAASLGLEDLAASQNRAPGGPLNQNLGLMDYGVCRGTDPACYHDWPRTPTTRYRILIYSRTGSSRHANLGKPLGPGLNPPLGEDNVAQREMLRLAAENGWDADYTEDVTQMTSLTGYNAVIFLSTSREILDDSAKTALRQYIRAGGGFVAIHNAFGTLYNWPYYEGLIGGTNFYDHLPARDGDVVIVDRKDASTKNLPARFRFHDEWYNLVPFPSRVRFLATVDEKSQPVVTIPRTAEEVAAQMGAPGARLPTELLRPRYPSVVGRSPGHGNFHPVAWCQYYDGGKVWATTLGHDADAFRKDGQPGANAFQTMIVGGIKSVMGQVPFCR
jgi:type 1 glutamine amidotransferase